MKRKIIVHGKIDLMETSAVGLPAYPYAHASADLDSFSLIKTLTNARLRPGFIREGEEIPSEELNLEEKEAMEDTESAPEITEKKVEVEKTETEKKVETEAKPEMNEIAKAIADGLKAGLKELETERGLVEKQTPVKKSLGEIALGMHNSAYNLNR